MCCPRRYTGNSGRCRVATRTTGIVVCTGDEAGLWLAGWVLEYLYRSWGEVSWRGETILFGGGGGLVKEWLELIEWV